MKALFRGIFRCRACGHVHGAYGVQVARYEVWYPVMENGGREPDRCPRCNAICQYLAGTRIPTTSQENNTTLEHTKYTKFARKRGGRFAKKAG